MMSKLAENVNGSAVLTWLVIAALVGYFAYKEWPEFKRRVSGRVAIEAQARAGIDGIEERLSKIEHRLDSFDEKFQRDFDHINDLERQMRKNTRAVDDSLKERKIIMEALLGCLGGLQEIGANGPTKAAEQKIHEYLNEQAHID